MYPKKEKIYIDKRVVEELSYGLGKVFQHSNWPNEVAELYTYLSRTNEYSPLTNLNLFLWMVEGTIEPQMFRPIYRKIVYEILMQRLPQEIVGEVHSEIELTRDFGFIAPVRQIVVVVKDIEGDKERFESKKIKKLALDSAEALTNETNRDISLAGFQPEEILAFGTIVFSVRHHTLRKLMRRILCDIDFFESFHERTGRRLALFVPQNANPKALALLHKEFDLNPKQRPYFVIFQIIDNPNRIEYVALSLIGTSERELELELLSILKTCEDVLEKIQEDCFDNATEIFNLLKDALIEERRMKVVIKVVKIVFPNLIRVIQKLRSN